MARHIANREPPHPEHEPALQAGWDKIVLRLSIGTIVLTALGVIVKLIAIMKAGFSWPELRPYVMGFFIITALLILLNVTLKKMQDAELSAKAKKITAAVLIGLALCVLALGVIWLGGMVFIDLGVLKPPFADTPALGALEQYDYVTAPTYASSNLPDDVFGSLTDDVGKPRKWMDLHERGAQTKMNDSALLSKWLLSSDFKNATIPFTAYVYVGTADGIEIDAYLIRNDGYLQTWPLTQTQGQGPKDEYLFDVPKSKAGDRLLVYIGIKEKSFKAIDPDSKFLIRSQTRKKGAT
jgi:hypothetical protein